VRRQSVDPVDDGKPVGAEQVRQIVERFGVNGNAIRVYPDTPPPAGPCARVLDTVGAAVTILVVRTAVGEYDSPANPSEPTREA